MLAVSRFLKAPLEECTKQILGKCYSVGGDSTLACVVNKIKTIALVIFYTLLLIPSLPIWFIGDMIEWVTPGGSAHLNDKVEIPLDTPVMLDPASTQYLGSSMSTYQNTSNRNMAENSDWGQYVKKHFSDAKTADLAPGFGIDILTDAGLEEIIRATKASGGNTLRFSIEWADICPDGGSTINELRLAPYLKAARRLFEEGIKPMLTLHHFVTPCDAKGKPLFEDRKAIDHFVSFAEKIYERFHPYTDTIFTFNEPHVNSVMNYVMGEFPQKGKANFWKHQLAVSNMMEAHKRIHTKLHEMAKTKGKEVKVGLTHQTLRFIPSSRWNYLARIVCFVMTYLFHGLFMEFAKKNKTSIDLLGIQYYTRPLIGGWIPDSTHRKDEKMVESMKFRFHPEGIAPILDEVCRELPGIPIMVTETGTAGENSIRAPDEMDSRRAEYYRKSVQAVYLTQQKHKDRIVGYLFWSLFDNFEWAHGRSKKHGFGVIARDPQRDQIRLTEGFKTLTTVYQATAVARAHMHQRAA